MALIIHDFVLAAELWTESDKLTVPLAHFLAIEPTSIKKIVIQKKSLDARKKGHPLFRFQLEVQLQDEGIFGDRYPTAVAKEPHVPLGLSRGSQVNAFRHPPVIIGSGPAGIFAALTLAQAGIKSVIIERGEAVEHRFRTMNRLRNKGQFSDESNYCFGEGGAGTFSDGKLTCGRNHPLIRHIFSHFVAHGAPEDILYEAHPHIGTDYLMRIALNMRRGLISQVGAEFRFNSIFSDFTTGGRSAQYEVVLNSGERIPTDHLILAVGHSARDTYEMLLAKGLAMVPKPFAMGARIEHPQEVINQIQYGSCDLPQAAEYKLAAHQGERGIWTFCMCPGGYLLPTGAQHGHLAINGMSYHKRQSGFANAAVVVNVLREDFYRGHPLDGMYFQQKIEQQAFLAGGGNYHAPAQRLLDFQKGRLSKGEMVSTYKPGTQTARLDQILPDFIVESLRGALGAYNQKMRGFINSRALVVGVETKTSAPISMVRNEALQSVSHSGLFPCGEGAGFAGGIISAALDGVRVGEAVLNQIQCFSMPLYVIPST